MPLRQDGPLAASAWDVVQAIVDLWTIPAAVGRGERWLRVNEDFRRWSRGVAAEATPGGDVCSLVAERDRAELRALIVARAPSSCSVCCGTGPRAATFELQLHPLNVAEGDLFVLTVRVSDPPGSLVRVDPTVAMGHLAASVAHGINTSIAQVFTDAAIARDTARELYESLTAHWQRGDIAAVRAAVQTLLGSASRIQDGVTTVAGITHAMSLFSDQAVRAPVRVDPSITIDAVIDLCATVARQRAKLISEVGVLPAVMSASARLGHLLLSIVLAAVERIPESDTRPHEVRIRAYQHDRTVRVEVFDTGSPIALGGDVGQVGSIATCRALAEAIGVTFTARRVLEGNEVAVVLPVAAPPSDKPDISHAESPGPPQMSRGRVLVVDDEKVFLELVCNILRLDHEVVGVTTAREALARVERGERFDVILCDMMMPAMTGADLYDAIARIAPHVARTMIFLTAGAFTERTQAFLANTRVPHYDKPIEPDELREIIRARVRR